MVARPSRLSISEQSGRQLENLLKTLATAAIGIGLGLFSTWLAVERGYGFGAVNAGPWTAWPKSGSSEADPYARAVVARSAEIPLGLAEGLTFVARQDDAGALLDPKCDYRVSGPLPPARTWTMTLMTPRGGLIDNPVHRFGFTSGEIVREKSQSIDIAVSRYASAGNWLPLGQQVPFVLALRLYDTIVRASASAIDAAAMPSITRGTCE